LTRLLSRSFSQDLAGDAFFFHTVYQFKYKGWVSAMLVPYTVLFAAACCVSLSTCLVKFRLFVYKWRSRGVHGQSEKRRSSLGGVPISPHLSAHRSVRSLKDRFDVHRLERYQYYGYLLVAVFEDLPMGTALLLAMMRLPASAEPVPPYHVRRGQGL
jgi:hypothetical protein